MITEGLEIKNVIVPDGRIIMGVFYSFGELEPYLFLTIHPRWVAFKVKDQLLTFNSRYMERYRHAYSTESSEMRLLGVPNQDGFYIALIELVVSSNHQFHSFTSPFRIR